MNRRPRLTVVNCIIFLNLLVYLAWTFADREDFMMNHFLVSWEALLDGRYWTLLTSVFSQQSFFHFLVNMLVLLSFGSVLESVLGPRLFSVFYVAAGLISSLSHCLVSTLILGNPEQPALGASGAIAGLVLVFALVFPREKILLFAIIPLPALFGALAFVALDLWGLSAQAHGGGLPIGHGAHLGGALSGVLFYFFYLRPRIQRRRQLEPL